MKRVITLLVLALALTACSSGSTPATEAATEVVTEVADMSNLEEEVKQNIPQDTQLDEIRPEGENRILLKLNIAGEGSDLFKMNVENAVSTVTEYLLSLERWTEYHLEINDLGTIAFNDSEKETTEIGSYFSLELIEEKVASLIK